MAATATSPPATISVAANMLSVTTIYLFEPVGPLQSNYGRSAGPSVKVWPSLGPLSWPLSNYGLREHPSKFTGRLGPSEVIVGRRRRHRAGVRRRRPRGQRSSLWPQCTVGSVQHGHWCRVRAPSTVRDARGRPISFNHTVK